MGVVQLRRVSSPQTGAVSYYFNKAREQEGADADYYFNLGYAYVMERDPQAAIYWLREAVRRDPTDGVAHWVLGALLLSTGASAEGTREKELAHRLSSEYAEWDRRPASDPIPRGLERVKETLVRPVPSDLAFVTTEQRDQRELATFHLERARRLFEQEHDREAATELRRAVYLSPYHAEAHLLLGRIYIRSGQLREAIDELKVSLWSEATAPAHAALAEAYLQAHEDTAARTEAQRALALDPKSEAARKVLAKLPPGRP
jgi:tetratricopeptide (TPR) repeat protein